MAEDDIPTDNEPEDEDVYVTYDIATYPSDLTLAVLKDMWGQGDISMPSYQRNFVWSIKQSSLLIESFLLGLPVPQAFFYVDENNKNLVIDGQQRILSIVFFLSGYFGDENFQGKRQVFRLTGISPKSPYLKKRFEDLDDKDKRKLLNSVLRVVNIRQMRPRGDDTAAYHIFERLNTGGTPLTPQEIRNCVFHGPIVQKLNDLNRDSNWRKIIGRSSPDKHQRDVEMILRIFAMFRDWEHYEKPMKEFLNTTMEKERAADSAKFLEFAARFRETCESVVKNFGEKPFHVRGPINLAALDAAMTALFRSPPTKWKAAARSYDSLKVQEDFQNSIYFNTSDAVTVAERMRLALAVL